MKNVYVENLIQTFKDANKADLIPIGHLRFSDKFNRIRIHYFEDDHRYPNDEQELNDTLNLLNNIYSQLFNANQNYLLLGLFKSDSNTEEVIDRIRPNKQSSKVYKYDDLLPAYYTEDAYCIINTFEISNINNTKIKYLFELVIDDQIDEFAIISNDLKLVFVPYDGGIDILTHDMSIIGELNKKYSERVYGIYPKK